MYLLNQKKAWKSLHLRSYIFGMLFTNTLGWIFMLGSEIVIAVTLISLFLFMWLTWPEKSGHMVLEDTDSPNELIRFIYMSV